MMPENNTRRLPLSYQIKNSNWGVNKEHSFFAYLHFSFHITLFIQKICIEYLVYTEQLGEE